MLLEDLASQVGLRTQVSRVRWPVCGVQPWNVCGCQKGPALKMESLNAPSPLPPAKSEYTVGISCKHPAFITSWKAVREKKRKRSEPHHSSSPNPITETAVLQQPIPAFSAKCHHFSYGWKGASFRVRGGGSCQTPGPEPLLSRALQRRHMESHCRVAMRRGEVWLWSEGGCRYLFWGWQHLSLL